MISKKQIKKNLKNSNRPVKILLYDLEISPILGWTYSLWDTNVIKMEKPSHIMSLSWKWLGEETIYNSNQMENLARFKNDPHDDTDQVKALWKILDQANIVIGHNAKRFDNRMANAMFLQHDMTPPSSYKTIDTLQALRRIAMLPSNALGKAGDLLGLGTKTEETHSDLWYDCYKGDKKAWKKMIKYNNQDVVLLEKLYLLILPYISNHPNMATIMGNPHVCPKCGSFDIRMDGLRYNTTTTYQRWRCLSCFTNFSDRIKEKEEPPEFVNYN